MMSERYWLDHLGDGKRWSDGFDFYALCDREHGDKWRASGTKEEMEFLLSALNTRPADGELVEKAAAAIAKSDGVAFHLMHNPDEKGRYMRYARSAVTALQRVSISRECLEELIEAAESTAEEFSDDQLKEDSFISSAVSGLRKRIAEAKQALEHSNGR
jgi:hypothetical protein